MKSGATVTMKLSYASREEQHRYPEEIDFDEVCLLYKSDPAYEKPYVN